MLDPSDYIDRITQEMQTNYPPIREARYRERIAVHIAFRESVHDLLRPDHWSRDSEERRPYLIDPLGERIPYVWSDLLFGVDPGIFASAKSDQDAMDEMVNENDLPSELQHAEWVCSSEGEVWYRIVPDTLEEHACIEWHSRLNVVPLWIGRKLVAAAFVSELDRDKTQVWRYVEVHVDKKVRRMLFVGGLNSHALGRQIPLTDRPETSSWDAEWDHGLDMLAGRIVNKLGGDRHIGISDFDGIEDLLLSLNETLTIGQENARLTAKQRAIIPQRFLNMAGNFPRGQEILIATETDQDPETIKNQVAMIEFEFDATALIAYKGDLTDTVLTRARVAPQLVGLHTEGAQTGPALRARLIDSLLAAQGKGKRWDDTMPTVLQRASQVEALSTDKGGLGISWTNTKDPPAFRRSSSLPEDPSDLARRLAISVNAEMLSRKTAIAESHPEWDDSRVQDEIDQIMKEVGSGAVGPEQSVTNPYRPGTINPGSTLPNPNDPAKPKPGDLVTPSAETAPEKNERQNGPNGNHA